jgi:lipopolysaccharide transport system ATP-binding protein
LEVGTGFHPELTGRENVYLNGAILGMRKAEIERKFDEIVAFAEIEKFIDTPVKWYSSGMYMRLAFAVAANFEPEILIVDEVLAVGDGPFQKKCLAKMGEISHAGRTVIFVSHNMSAIETLCNRVLWLVDGELMEGAETEKVVSDYVTTELVVLTERVWNDPETAPGNDGVRLHKIRVRLESESSSDLFTMQTPFLVEVDYWNLVPGEQLHIVLHLYTEQGIVAFTTGSASDPGWRNRHLSEGLFRSVCYIPGNLLNAGFHYFDVLVVKDKSLVNFQYPSAVTFEVVDMAEKDGWSGKEPGVVQPALKWTTDFLGTTPRGCHSAKEPMTAAVIDQHAKPKSVESK